MQELLDLRVHDGVRGVPMWRQGRRRAHVWVVVRDGHWRVVCEWMRFVFVYEGAGAVVRPGPSGELSAVLRGAWVAIYQRETSVFAR